MEVSFLLGFVIMWTAILFARRVSVKEITKLSTEKKAELIDMGTGKRGMQVAILVVGIAAFYIISLLINEQRELWFGLYGLFILLWMVYRLQVTLKEYKTRDFSQEFIISQRNAGLIRLLGIIGFFVCVGVNFLVKG